MCVPIRNRVESKPSIETLRVFVSNMAENTGADHLWQVNRGELLKFFDAKTIGRSYNQDIEVRLFSLFFHLPSLICYVIKYFLNVTHVVIYIYISQLIM